MVASSKIGAETSDDGPRSGEASTATLADAILAEGPRIPRATYRVQLNGDFSFADARSVLDYLAVLGISDLYTSPFFCATEGSTHGYDLADHNALNDAIGSRVGLEALANDLHARGMGLLLDFVPNHMGVSTRNNRWWMDVLENGPSSLHASHFDIDWSPLKTELSSKVLLPILGDHYGRVLEDGHLKVGFEHGAFYLSVYERELPINPRTFPVVLEAMLGPIVMALGDDHDATLELMSVITGLKNLPTMTETRRAKVMERRREKEILKRRLATLVTDFPIVGDALRVSLEQLNGRKGEPQSFDALDGLLEQQAYRLSYWRVAAEEINYRRFFDVNDLAAIRVEQPRVFEEAHRMLFELLGRGIVTGLRIDHPDGLWEPKKYFRDLQRGFVHAKVVERLGARASSAAIDARFENAIAEGKGMPLYVVAEKILARGETTPERWPVHGTTGYDFGVLVGGVFVDPSSEATMSRVYDRFVGRSIDFSKLVYEKKKLILRTALASELNVLAHALNRLSERDRHSRDFTLGVLTDALREVIACFPVYRTYVDERTEDVSSSDRAAIAIALRLARRRNPTTDTSVYAFLRNILLLEPPAGSGPERLGQYREIVMKMQQLTSPVMAKGVEDTAFYIFNRLVSLNEVGGEPERWGASVEELHASNVERQARAPHTLLATSTHDTKRSEDVRARISVLSEIPAAWEAAVLELGATSGRFKVDFDGQAAPDRDEEYLFYQTIVGTWPGASQVDDAYVGRIARYMQKAAREAKVNTSWIDPEPDYDRALERFAGAMIREGQVQRILGDVLETTAHHGRWASLAMTLLKITSPGVPDFYQGTEIWDDSLVDPDNRRPVDFDARRSLLFSIERELLETSPLELARALVAAPEDGRIKLHVIRAGLAVRGRYPELFGATSEYRAERAEGHAASHVIAFSRRHEERRVVVVAPRLTAKLAGGKNLAPIGRLWRDTTLTIEPGVYEDYFTGRTVDADGPLPLARVLADFPLALLVRSGGG